MGEVGEVTVQQYIGEFKLRELYDRPSDESFAPIGLKATDTVKTLRQIADAADNESVCVKKPRMDVSTAASSSSSAVPPAKGVTAIGASAGSYSRVVSSMSIERERPIGQPPPRVERSPLTEE